MKLITSHKPIFWIAVFLDFAIGLNVLLLYFGLHQRLLPMFYVSMLLMAVVTVQAWYKRDKPFPGEPPVLTSLQKNLIWLGVAGGFVYLGYNFVTLFRVVSTLL